MAENGPQLELGDWIVHLHYGVGKIEGIEKKRLDGVATSYYRVATDDSTLWIPVAKIDHERVRPLASPKEFSAALKELENPPKELNPDHMKRKNEISEVKADVSLMSICQLVRDLSARQTQTKLSTTEQRVLERLQRQLLQEWSLCMHIEVDEARQQLDQLLHQHIATV